MNSLFIWNRIHAFGNSLCRTHYLFGFQPSRAEFKSLRDIKRVVEKPPVRVVPGPVPDLGSPSAALRPSNSPVLAHTAWLTILEALNAQVYQKTWPALLRFP